MQENGKNGNSLTDPMVLAKLSRLEVRARGVVEGSFSGMHKSPHRGSSVEFAEYRKYVPGDDIKHVDWKVFAKTDRFYIKEFEADTNLRCHLVVDRSASMGYGSVGLSKYEYARKMAATLAQILVQQGDAVGLQCFDERVSDDLPARASPRHLHNVFDILKKGSPEGRTEIIGVLHALAEKIRRRAMIVVFSDFFTETDELLDCFQHMKFRKHDLAVFHLMDPEELEFGFDRSVKFVDMESSVSVVTEPAVMRNAYMRELGKYLDEMRRGCLEFHVDYRMVNISTPYDAVLMNFLLARNR